MLLIIRHICAISIQLCYDNKTQWLLNEAIDLLAQTDKEHFPKNSLLLYDIYTYLVQTELLTLEQMRHNPQENTSAPRLQLHSS